MRHQSPTKPNFGTNFAHNVNFPGNLGELTGIVYGHNGRCRNPTKLIFGTDFVHNVNFPGNLGELTGIVFDQSGSLSCVDLWNSIEIFQK